MTSMIPEQIVFDCPRRQVDEVTAVVEREDLHILRQDLVVELLGLLLNPLEYGLCLLACAQLDHAFDRVVLVLVAEPAESRRGADDHLPDVLHEDRDAVVHDENNVPDVLGRRDATEPADVVELTALGVEAAAGIAVVRVQRGRDVAHAEPRPGELVGVDHHLVLHRLAA